MTPQRKSGRQSKPSQKMKAYLGSDRILRVGPTGRISPCNSSYRSKESSVSSYNSKDEANTSTFSGFDEPPTSSFCGFDSDSPTDNNQQNNKISSNVIDDHSKIVISNSHPNNKQVNTSQSTSKLSQGIQDLQVRTPSSEPRRSGRQHKPNNKLKGDFILNEKHSNGFPVNDDINGDKFLKALFNDSKNTAEVTPDEHMDTVDETAKSISSQSNNLNSYFNDITRYSQTCQQPTSEDLDKLQYELFQEEMSTLKTKRRKLVKETEMLELKKDVLKLQKEKLKLEVMQMKNNNGFLNI